jgi:hypothetical protein
MNNIAMVLNIRDRNKMEKETVKDNIFIKTEDFMREAGKIIKWMVMEHSIFLMDQWPMTEIGEMTNFTVMVYNTIMILLHFNLLTTTLQMDGIHGSNMKVNLEMTQRKDSVPYGMKTVINISEDSKMMLSTGKDHFILIMIH